MFVKRDNRKVREILEDEADDKKDLFLARRNTEFVNGTVRHALCRSHQVQKMEVLEHLSLYKNDLVTLAGMASLEACKRLVSLDVGENLLKEIPVEIGRLISLESFAADRNELRSFEPLIALKNLKVLRLSGNKIETVPSSIGELEHLEKLVIDGNEIATLPEEIGQLGNLEYLNVRKNRLVALPETLGLLSNLKQLIASSNHLTCFLSCSSTAQLSSLVKLQLNGNQIVEFPMGILSLPSCQINLANNRIAIIPSEAGDNVVAFGQVLN